MQALALLGVWLVAVLFFIMPLIGAIVGAFSGWIVGWFFDETILGIFTQIGIKDVAMWQIGCFLGFVGGFFKASLSSSENQ